MKQSFKLLAILIFSIFNNCLAQESFNDIKNQVKFSPLRLIDFVIPSIEFGFERNHGNFSSEFILGGIRSTNYPLVLNKIIGYRIGFEEKYFFQMPKSNETYIAINLIYSNFEEESIERFGLPWHDSLAVSMNYLDTFSYKKQVLSLSFKVGIQKAIYKNLKMDIGLGAGIRYRNVKHYNKLIQDDDFEGHRHNFVYPRIMNEGEYFGLNLLLNLKLGYCF